jgi:hypothetical protein
MNWTKLSVTALAAALIAAPATAYADDPVPTVDQVVAIMAELTDPGRPAASKTDIVTPGFAPDEAGTIDDHLRRMDGRSLPINFVVTNIQPAPYNSAGATIATNGFNSRMDAPPGPIVLVEQGGRWLITHDSAMNAMNALWYNATRRIPPRGQK